MNLNKFIVLAHHLPSNISAAGTIHHTGDSYWVPIDSSKILLFCKSTCNCEMMCSSQGTFFKSLANNLQVNFAHIPYNSFWLKSVNPILFYKMSPTLLFLWTLLEIWQFVGTPEWDNIWDRFDKFPCLTRFFVIFLCIEGDCIPEIGQLRICIIWPFPTVYHFLTQEDASGNSFDHISATAITTFHRILFFR